MKRHHDKVMQRQWERMEGRWGKRRSPEWVYKNPTKRTPYRVRRCKDTMKPVVKCKCDNCKIEQVFMELER